MKKDLLPGNPDEGSEFLLYQTEDGQTRIQVRVLDETVWLSQLQMAELFQTTKQNVSLHIRNVYSEGELETGVTVKEYLTVQQEGNRTVERQIAYYNLDVIISVGYRVRSHRGTQFRQWATKQLRELIVKGFVLDDERLKEGRRLGQDYFDELLERILAFLKRNAGVDLWHDRQILPGQNWEGQISEYLNSADIILLLISSDFAASEYCWDVEAKRALERHDQGTAVVVPIIIRPVDGWDHTPIGKLKALPTDGTPVTTWDNCDEAYSNIAEALYDLINNWPNEKAYAPPQWIDWYLKPRNPEDRDGTRIRSVTAKLRKAANSTELDYVGLAQEDNRWQFRSTQSVFDKLLSLHNEGKLEQIIEETILELVPGVGAALRIESRIVNEEFQFKTHYMPEKFGDRTLEEGFPPFVGGITFPLDNPLQIGFSLLSDASLSMPTPEEQVELQWRLGRYLNTFLVLGDDQINVNLSPVDDYCGVPPLLRYTELGRDMLAQDIVLKHHTAAQMHPCTEQGKAFWQVLESLSPDQTTFEACFRVWIVPDHASVHEKSEDGMGHVTLEKFGLKVLCEADYESLKRFRHNQGKTFNSPKTRSNDEKVIDLFRQLIVPEIQREVSIGPRFGILRQILSVMIVATWIKRSELGEMLKQAGFLGSNAPEKYGLNTINEDVLYAMKQLYLQMFGDGIWQYVRTKFDAESSVVERRLYVAGGINMHLSRNSVPGGS